MSFLNPVNEPVLRFKSTDASAPQINYNARTAGDVKAVLKACLVTGYGATDSAGWTITNEVDHVAEFVSPSTAMSDYRLGIDDTSASSTTWYYQYQDARVNPIKNNPTKSIDNITRSSGDNGWQLLVTERAVIYIEIFYVPSANGGSRLARITFLGQVKSALTSTNAVNMGFWCTGWNSTAGYPYSIFSDTASNAHYNVEGKSLLSFSCANQPAVSKEGTTEAIITELTSPIYLYKDAFFVAEQPGLLVKKPNDPAILFGVRDTVFFGRPVLHVCVSLSNSANTNNIIYGMVFLIYLDYWEY